jgi:dipeptidyl aminopeptidase/acylaminoacyl peptidase
MSPEKMAENLKSFKDTNDLYEQSYTEVVDYYTSPHQQAFAVYDPVTDFPNISCPILVMFGEKDAHVVVASNKPAVAGALKNAGTMDFTMKVMPGVDHGYSTRELYKQGIMGAGVLEFLADWVHTRTSAMVHIP